jgi:hypothetical protein
MPELEMIVGVRALVDFLTERGYRITYATASKMTSPKIGKGPPIEGYFGNLPAFTPDKVLSWYRSRITPQRSLLVTKRRPKTAEERRIEKERRRGRQPKLQPAPQTDEVSSS